MSGTSFSVVFLWTFIADFILNVFVFEEINQLNFYLIGAPYFVFIMFCMTAYRGTRELCFYCKFPIGANLLALTVMIVFYLKSVPKLYFILAGIIFLFVVLIKGAKNEEEKKEREKRKLKKKDDGATIFDKVKELKSQ